MKRIFDGTPQLWGEEDHAVIPFRPFIATGQSYTFTLNVADPSKPIRVALAFTDYPGNPLAYEGQINKISIYVLQGGFVYCDGGSYDADGYSIRATGCFLPDLYNNAKFLSIAPNSFTGSFQLQIVATGINAKAVPGLDGASNNQDFAVWVYNGTL